MKTYLMLAGLISAGFLALALSPTAAQSQADYTVHEWGTFTSVQGGDGKLLSWRPLLTSELPGFVCNWNRPGLNRSHVGPSPSGKISMVTLQRMETPVIYFYSDYDMNVDVSVNFPGGLITEWYPQATQIGPSKPLDPNIPTTSTLGQSRAVWENLRLLAPKMDYTVDAARLPQDKSGSHYFAARETGSDLVQMDYAGPTNPVTEYDKFIFYRGAGSFKTPLCVQVDTNDDVLAENTGPVGLADLFLVNVRDTGHGKIAAFTVVKKSGPGATVPFPSLKPVSFVPLEKFQADIAAQMQDALVAAGLYKAEAAAMVATWKDSWFAEEGERVLYILPRDWTDEILPLTLDPPPKKLERVMVGRAEIITPGAMTHLLEDMTAAQGGNSAAHDRAIADWKSFGRFAPPVFGLLFAQGASTNLLAAGVQLFTEAEQPKN